MAKSNEEIEKLKANWRSDPIWDLEDTEGFEDYRGELKAYSDNIKAQWEEAATKHRVALRAKVCPIMQFTSTNANSQQQVYEYAGCLVGGCAWWHGGHGCCSIPAIANNLGEIGNQLYNK